MNTLQSNIKNLFKERGLRWLNNLPDTTNALAKHWDLSDILPVDNMTFNYVARATKNQHHAVVLKISCDKKLIDDEIRALQHFHGHGAVRLVEHNAQHNAILLQQAIPGITMKSYRAQHPAELSGIIEQFIKTAKKLHSSPAPSTKNFSEIKKWLQIFNRIDTAKMPPELLKQAKNLSQDLITSQQHAVLLHGDLHLDNILQHKDSWLAIDPKGLVGEPEFEIAGFDFLSEEELKTSDNLSDLLHHRIQILAEKSSLSLKRLQQWYLIRLALAIAWCVEDNVDASKWMRLYKIFKS